MMAGTECLQIQQATNTGIFVPESRLTMNEFVGHKVLLAAKLHTSTVQDTVHTYPVKIYCIAERMRLLAATNQTW